MLDLKTRLETKLREELSHGSKTQASLLPSSPSSSFWAFLLCQGTFPRVVMGWKRARGGQDTSTA